MALPALAAVVSVAAVVAAPPSTWTEPRTGMTFVFLPPGRFVMGSPPGEPQREAEETPHEVTLPLGLYLGRSNAWGLFDLHGNVWEWTEDDHCRYAEGPTVDPLGRCDSGLKVIRGSSWAFDVGSARCALRYTHPPGDRGYSLGFRVAREPPD